MMLRTILGLLTAALIWTGSANAQTSYAFYYGFVPTPAQWNSYFANKQDTLGYPPLNSQGGTMTGRLVTTPPGATTAGFNLTPGTAPGSPANGDIWATSGGIFGRAGGVTYQFGGACTAFTATVNGCVPHPTGVNGYFLRDDGTFQNVSAGGTVTSVGLTLPAIFSVTGSPVTLSGTLAATLANQNSNQIFAGPASGGAATPAFRALVAADIPVINNTSLNPGFVIAGTGLTGASLSGGGTIGADIASSSNIWGGTSGKLIDAGGLFGGAANMVALSGTTSITPNFTLGINFTFTATSATNYTLANPTITSAMVGRDGCIYVNQPASGTVVSISYGTVWQSGGGSSTKTLTPTLGAQDRICYKIVSTSEIDFTIGNAIAH